MMKDLLLKFSSRPKSISSTDDESCGGAGSDTSGVLNSDDAREEGLCMDSVSVSSVSQVSSERPLVPKPPTAPTSPITPEKQKSTEVKTPPSAKRSSTPKGPGKDATPRKHLKTNRELNDTL